MTREQVVAMLREKIAEAGTASAFAKAHGISSAYITDTLQGRRDPGEKILDALGLEKLVAYQRKPRGERTNG